MNFVSKLRACGSQMSPRTPCNVAWLGGLLAGLGSLASGALGALGSSSNNKTSKSQFQQQMEFNQQEAALNRWFQKDFWNMTFDRQSAYNSIGAQRARAKASGLNPDLSSTAETATTGSATTGAQAEAPAASHLENSLGYLGNGIANAANSAVSAYNQTKETQASAQLKDSLASYNDVLNAGAKLENILKGGTLTYLQSSAESQAEILRNQAFASQYEAEYKQYVTQDARYSAMHSMLQAVSIDPMVIQQMDVGIQQTMQSIELMKKQGALTDKQVDKLANDMLLGWSNLRVMQFEAATNRQNANINAYNAQTNRMDVNSKVEQRKHENNLTDARTAETWESTQDKRVDRNYRVNTLYKGMKAYYDFQSKLYDAKGRTMVYNEYLNSATGTIKAIREAVGVVSDVKGIANPMQGSYQGTGNNNGYSFSPQDFGYQ